jgi:hypothetical protein
MPTVVAPDEASTDMDGGCRERVQHQNGTSTWPFVVFDSSWFDTW